MAVYDTVQTLNLKNSVYNTTNGRYVIGGTTEVSSFALEWWTQTVMQRDPTDLVYVMEKKYEGRPDMLGYVFYADAKLWWVIGQYNSILDPMTELVEGKILLVPTLARVKKDLISPNMTVGGVTSTRT